MGIPVLATDPQYVFPYSSAYPGAWIACSFSTIGPFGLQMVLCQLTNIGYDDQEWMEFGIPFGPIVQAADVATPAQRVTIMQADIIDINVGVLAKFPNSIQPDPSWINTYSGPQPFSLSSAMSALLNIYNAVQSAHQTQSTYIAIGVLRDLIIKSQPDNQIITDEETIWTSYIGQSRSQLLASLQTFDAIYIPTLPTS